MPNYRYNQGRQFETKVSGWLADRGLAVVRAAGSKGTGKMDLVAFSPDGRVLIIQCKTTGAISPAEWNRLVEVAGWSLEVGGLYGKPAGWPVVPLVAMRGERAKPGQDWTPRFMRLAESKIPRSRNWPWKLYDAEHGCDLDGTDAPGSGHSGT
jgi:hypothetical protein